MSEIFNQSVLDAINRAVQDGISTTALEVDGTPQYCIINAETREIEIPGELNIFGVESDEKSTRVYFRCPKYVGTNVDLDMTKCMVYVPYRNANGEKDQYIVTDLNETEDGENVEFTWLISRKASAYMGITEFGIRAIKTAVGGTIEAEWNTTVASANVIRGMDVGLLEFSEENKDALAQAMDLVKQELEQTKSEMTSEIETKGQQTLDTIPDDYTTAAQNALSAKTEVEDIRVGADGTVHANAGDAVREQINKVSDDIKENNIYDKRETYNLYNNNNTKDNYSLYTNNGVPFERADYGISEKIDVRSIRNHKLYCTQDGLYDVGTNVKYFYYSGESTFIGSSNDEIGSTVPSTADYLILNGYKTYISSYTDLQLCVDTIRPMTEYGTVNVIKEKIVEPASTTFFLFNKKNLYNGIKIDGARIAENGYIRTSDNFVSDYIPCEEQKKVYISYDNDGERIQTNFTGIKCYDENYGEIENSFQSYTVEYNIPKGAKYIKFSALAKDKIMVEYDRISDEYIEHDKPYIPKEYNDPCKEYYNKSHLFLGDSTTHIGLWVEEYVKMIKPSNRVKLALSQATLCDHDDTVYSTLIDKNQDTEFIDFTGTGGVNNNTLCNQIERLKLARQLSDEMVTVFDHIYILISFNDYFTDTVIEEMESFFTNGIGYIPITEIDKTKWSGAMRYCIETLHEWYPSAKIHILCPFQSAFGVSVNGSYAQSNGKSRFMQKISERFGLKCIRTDLAGIYGGNEKANENGEDLADGLHQNESGAYKIALFVFEHIVRNFY